MNEYSRIEKMLGKDFIGKINKLTVMIVGLGGVGGIALEVLARSGICNFVLVDYDVIEKSNLNRQILTTLDNIGKFKTEAAKERLSLINKNCKLKIYNKKVDNNFFDLELPKIDFIVDACDDINAKILLIKYALKNNIEIISSCGTGNKIHPEMLEITNIWKTEQDPLAKALRTRLKKENLNYKLPVVCSKEPPLIKTKDSVGSLATVTNSAGILLASYVINKYIN